MCSPSIVRSGSSVSRLKTLATRLSFPAHQNYADLNKHNDAAKVTHGSKENQAPCDDITLPNRPELPLH
jgi:hypothetical protein